MGTYYVKMPFTGYVGIEVEADSEEAAVDAFHDAYDKSTGLLDHNHEMEWEFTEYVTRGNVCGAVLREMEIECLDGEEGDEA